MTTEHFIRSLTGSIDLVICGTHYYFENGEKALSWLGSPTTISAVYVRDGYTVIQCSSFLTLMYITNDPQIAKIAEKYGVQRIWIDLETIGKEERQRNMHTVKSHHCISDIRTVSKVLTTSELLVRVNPISPGLQEEIERVIQAGADMIMLPMWRTVQDVRDFLGYINGRVKTCLLLETREAVECLDEVLELGGFNEIHIGLNDLYLSYGFTFLFETLANGIVESLCHKIAKKGIPYGFGGIARIGSGILPAERIVQEHYRLHSTRVILSRSFCDVEQEGDFHRIEEIFSNHIANLQDAERGCRSLTEEQLQKNRIAVCQIVEEIVAKSRIAREKEKCVQS